MKKYRVKKDCEDIFQQLINLGCNITATEGVINQLEIPDNVDIKDVEQITGLKFKEIVL